MLQLCIAGVMLVIPASLSASFGYSSTCNIGTGYWIPDTDPTLRMHGHFLGQVFLSDMFILCLVSIFANSQRILALASHFRCSLPVASYILTTLWCFSPQSQCIIIIVTMHHHHRQSASSSSSQCIIIIIVKVHHQHHNHVGDGWVGSGSGSGQLVTWGFK